MKEILLAFAIIITFLSIWGFCIASAGIWGIIFGFMPAWVAIEIMARVFEWREI
jgi:hypothetical protein